MSTARITDIAVGSRLRAPRRRAAHLATVLAAVLLAAAVPAASPAPVHAATFLPGFTEEVVWTGLVNPTAIGFAPDGRVFVAEKRGTIQLFDSIEDSTPTLFADLRTSVYNFWDRGLLGLAIDPQFPVRPYVYVLYTYDGVIGGTAPRFGVGTDSDPCPTPPGATTDGCVVSGRLSRLSAAQVPATASETVLIHDWCQQFPSHSVGDIAFGPDGALYASGGDGASFTFTDYGQRGNPCGDPPGAAGTALSAPTAEGGALRSQDVRTTGDPTTLDGTVIRVDPDTGAALPDNPLAGSADPNRSRIIAHGYRNPFRMTFRPGTDELWLGDVGANTWEEIDRITTPATGPIPNAGWPCYEGTGRQGGFDATNLNLCETLYTSGSVAAPFYTYAHDASVVTGDGCPTGSSSIAGAAFYEGGTYPDEYDGALFFADYSRRCIWAMMPGPDGVPSPANRRLFVGAPMDPVYLTVGPGGDLWYVDFGGSVRRIRYTAPLQGLFSDGFETGDMSRWTTSAGVTVQTAERYSGTYGARAVADAGSAWASRTLSATQPQVLARVRFKVRSQTGTAYLLRLLTANGRYVTGLYRTSGGTLALRNDFLKDTTTSTTPVALNTWHELQLRAAISGTAGETEVWLNGARVASLSGTRDLGVAGIGRVQIGDNNRPRTFDVAYDDVLVEASSIVPNRPPEAAVSATPTSGPAPLAVTLDARGSTDPDGDALTYQWDTDDDGAFDDGTGPTASVTYTDPGDHRARVRVADVAGASDIASVTISVDNAAPTATISTPAAGATWEVGDTIAFSGSASDPEDGTLAASRLSWEAILHHCPSNCHTHSLATFPGVASGSFTAPDHDYPSHLELRLTATDSAGATTTVTRELQPRTVELSFATSPSGLELVVNGVPGTAPFTRTVIEGSSTDVSAPADQTLNGTSYTFTSWSDGGAADHTVVATAPGTYTATYTAGAPPAEPLFTDGFETGDTSRWTSATGIVVDQADAFAGTWAARGAAVSASAWASKTLSASQPEVYFRVRFKVTSATGTVYIARLITAGGKYVTGLYRTSGGTLALRNDFGAVSVGSTSGIPVGVWHDLQLRAKVAGAAGETEVWLNGTRVAALSGTRDIGVTNIGRVQIGDNNAGRTYDLRWDDVTAHTVRVQP